MTSALREYMFKGVFLGLWVFFALQVPPERSAAWIDIFWVVGWVGAGLLVGILGGTILQWSRGFRPSQNRVAFPLLVLLESPTFIYGGIMLGLVIGILTGRPDAGTWSGPLANLFGLSFEDIKHLTAASLPEGHPRKDKSMPGDWLGYCAVGGILLGFVMYRFRELDGRQRFVAGVAVIAVVVYVVGKLVAAETDSSIPSLGNADARYYLGMYLVMGLPFFYLLSFCGEEDESGAEIMVFCAVVGAALQLMDFQSEIQGFGRVGSFLLPLVLFLIYVTRVLPGLRVFRHIVRGYAYMNVDRLALSIVFFRRALELDPENPLAAQGLITLHNNLTLAKLDSDPVLAESLDFGLCLDRAASLLMPPNPPPSAQDRAEAERFLVLVEQRKPAYLARIDYLRIISLMHAKQFDIAADTLARLLSPETPGYHAGVRKRVLFDAWDLALRIHPKLVERLGWPELNKPGRRIDAIGAVERKLAEEPNNPAAKEYRTMMYSQLQEGEFIAAASVSAPKDFSYEYVEQLGLALVDSSDPERRERGMGFMRIAGRGMPERAPGIYFRLAQAYEKNRDPENAIKCLEAVKQVGIAMGAGNLARDQRQFYGDALRKLAASAEARGDVPHAIAEEAKERGDNALMTAKDAEAAPHYEAAITDLKQYLSDGGGAALDAYRKLAGLYGKLRDPMNAVLMVETGLTYDKTDADLKNKKDSFYYSLDPAKLESVKEKVAKWFDVRYCVDKAMTVLNAKDGGVELLDWAAHLALLARIVQPDSNGVRLIGARVLMRRGERDEGLKILEDIREGEKGSGEDQDAWYTTTKLLGQLYLDELARPDLALRCFLDYKDYHKSGADSLFQIAKCYEAMGDVPSAIKFYQAVTVYEAHPLFYDAKEALRRHGKE